MTEAADPLALAFVEWIARAARLFGRDRRLEDLLSAPDHLGRCRRPRLCHARDRQGFWPGGDGDSGWQEAVARQRAIGLNGSITFARNQPTLLRHFSGVLLLLLGGEPAQAIRTQAIGAFDRHRQPYRFLRAPAGARRIAAECSSAG